MKELQVHGTRIWTQDCWLIVRIWATYDGKEFLADIRYEIDGRDLEFDTLWGDTDTVMEIVELLYEHECWSEISKAMDAAYN